MIIFHVFYSVSGVKRQLHWISSILFDFVRLYWFDWFENRTHSKIGVRFCSIAEPNRTIGVRLGSIGFCSVLFDWIGRALCQLECNDISIYIDVHNRVEPPVSDHPKCQA